MLHDVDAVLAAVHDEIQDLRVELDQLDQLDALLDQLRDWRANVASRRAELDRLVADLEPIGPVEGS